MTPGQAAFERFRTQDMKAPFWNQLGKASQQRWEGIAYAAIDYHRRAEARKLGRFPPRSMGDLYDNGPRMHLE